MNLAIPPNSQPSAAPGFGLIIIGDEILSGKRADKHLPKVIELLKARGLQLDYADYVSMNPLRAWRQRWCRRCAKRSPS